MIAPRPVLAASALVFAALACGQAQAEPHALLAHVMPEAVTSGAAANLGAVDPAQAMAVSVSLPMRNTAELDGLLQALYDPHSPQFRHYLSVAQYTARFGPTAADYAAVANFFARQGLHVRADAANRAMIQLTGTAEQFGKVLHVALNRYRNPAEDRDFVAPDREPTLDLDVAIQEVIGLDDEVLAAPRLITPAAGETAPDTTGSGPGGNFTGSDMRAAYYGDGPLTGAGQSVGLMELKGYDIASVNTYFANLGQTNHVPVVTVSTDSVPVDCITHCDDSEQALDIEYAISMAPRLASLEVYVGKPEDVLNSMASRNSAKQLSTSWGWKERFATDDALFKEMAAQGQTLLTASGDYSSLRKSGPWPEEDAYITGVGGTDLVTDGPGGAWLSETGWKYSAGGPSLDKTIPIQSYQKGFVTADNGASSRVRNVPDVAGQSNINMYLCGNRGCGRAGGTSFASPMWAGFIAMANQRAAAQGLPPVGFINPALYRLGASANAARVLHDQTEGVSGKFMCTASFDLVTGLGSMKAPLINALVKP